MPVTPRVTIAQISDLHINRKVKKPIKDAVKNLLSAAKPDILIVSGDLANQPVPWQMKKAAQLVEEIRQECHPAYTIVIPGNHDYKFWGNVGLRRITRIPFEIYFRRGGLTQGFWWRSKESLKLFCKALWPWSPALREPVFWNDFGAHKDWGLALFAINSNTLTEMMAAGKVEDNDFQQLYRALDAAQKDHGFPYRYKIALVHHHPAPIADAPSNAIARIQDSFMLFYNAGLFVRELSRRGFNLVLHGHKHVAGFVRVACEFPDLGRTVLPIASAGTATHPAPDDTRGNHLRVITIFDDDTASLHEHFFDGSVQDKEGTRSIPLETLEDVRRRRYRVFAETQTYSSRELVKNVEITPDGYTKVEIKERGCRVLPLQSLSEVRISLTAKRPSYLRGIEPAGESSAYVELRPGVTDLRNIDRRMYLGKTWTAEDGPFTYGYSYRLMNGHVLTAQEFVRHYSDTGEASEFASITCDSACDLLTLNVQFPPNYDLKSLEFQATAEYIPAPLQGVNDPRLDQDDAKTHDEETRRIGGSIRPYGNGYMLTCPDPVPAIMYKLRWKFLKVADDPGEPVSVAAAFDEARRKLLRIADNASTSAKAEFATTQSILRDLAADISEKLKDPNDHLHVTVMAFDDEVQRLKFVGTNEDALAKVAFISGESLAGFAFEKASSVIYYAKQDPIGYFIHPSEWDDPTQLTEPVVLACFPWFFEQEKAGRKLVGGVVNVSSKSPTTKLLTLFDEAQKGSDKTMTWLQNLSNYAVERLLEL